MTLPSSGSLTFLQIATEFRLATGVPPPSYGLSQYYRGGARVPVSSYTTGIPSSSTIKFSDFYGTQNRTTGTISYGYTTDNYYTFVVPVNVTTITVSLWGAAGGSGGGDSATSGKYGGGGGFATSTIPVNQGNTLKIYVGQGGGSGKGGLANGGGTRLQGLGGWSDGDTAPAKTGQNGGGGGGGGSSKILLSSTVLVVAQGGNGGGGGNNGSSGTGFGGVGGYNTSGRSGLNQVGAPGSGGSGFNTATTQPGYPGGGIGQGGGQNGSQNDGSPGGNGYVIISW
jgi:hypothetical protein